MNTVFHSAAEATTGGWLLGITTALFLVIFVAFSLWLMFGRSKAEWERDAMAPLEEE